MTRDQNFDASLLEAAQVTKSWPFEEARKLLVRFEKNGNTDGEVVFETGYGPSGLPHIGTFGEVARTAMVQQAFTVLTGRPSRIICFSDDMDGLRKVPTNIPNGEILEPHLGKGLTEVPDPFGTHNSFGEHNNARLQEFLDSFGFEYDFISSADYYRTGRFDDTLLHILKSYDKVMDIILPTLGPERQATYAPFLPICTRTRQVLQVPLVDRNVEAGTVTYIDPETSERIEIKVTGGACKLQWKVDWAMRWVALAVDYEMAGKDLIESVKLSSRICRTLGGMPPEGFSYELFLDENGEKISKSRGNGITIAQWLKYASPESLSLFMYQSPRKAKRLHFDIIPKNVDEYLTHLGKFEGQEIKDQLVNPVWHIHKGHAPDVHVPISFNVLLNIVSASNSEEPDTLWGFIQRYAPQTSPDTHPELNRMVGYAINYFVDFVKPAKTYRAPDDTERAALEDLSSKLENLAQGAAAQDIQTLVYESGKAHNFDNLRDWFKALYEVLLGQSQGPRFGSFVAIYGVKETRELIQRALAGEDLSKG